MQIPDTFLREECAGLGISLPAAGDYGVGMLFLPTHDDTRRYCEKLLAELIAEEGQGLLGWRDVPTERQLVPIAALESNLPLHYIEETTST